ncbi:hypothetical protein [Citrobacter meridianamericanus]|uniref:hypothetical protein n=1 Tax=Citrobacter meridianamericanus TaxID=2894201 RepID=UPI00351CF7E3
MANELTGTICNVADKVCQTVSVDVASIPVSLSLSAPDYADSAPYFILSFSTVMSLWLVSHCAGVIIKLIKEG